jgi:hypothetical protein
VLQEYVLLVLMVARVLYGNTGVTRVCIVAANGRTCAFLGVTWNISNI